MGKARANAQKKPRASSPPKKQTTSEKTSSSPLKDQNPKPKDKPSSPKTVKKEDQLLDSEGKTVQSKLKSPVKPKKESSSPKREKTEDQKSVQLKRKSPESAKSKESSSKLAKKEVQATDIEEKIAQLKKKASDFKPKSAAFWKDGEPVPFLFLARAFDLIANESGRIVITEIMCNVFRTVIATTPKDLIGVVYLSANKIAPSHEGIELGIGDSHIVRALAGAYGSKEAQIKVQLEKLGDLGLVAKASRSSQTVMFKPPPLTVVKVLDTFRTIAKESGKDSQDKKRNHIKGLLVAATDCEPQYIIRLLQSKLRIGLAEQTLLVALGHAAVYSEKDLAHPSQIQASLEEAAKMVKQVYSVLPNYDKIVTALLDGGVSKLSDRCGFSLGVPIGPMLAKPTKGVSEILDKFQDMEFTCEYKYDGERAQIHYMEDGSVEIYSRNAERNTGKYPDVVDAAARGTGEMKEEWEKCERERGRDGDSDGGVSKLSDRCGFSLGVPIGPMLAKPTKGVSEILDKFQDMEFTCEYKYDGERAQIHYMEDGSVEIYSRNAERNTGKYPDVVDAAARFKKASVRSFVLDCEVVAYDREKLKILPFQVLSTRARKGVIMSDITVKVCIYAFDILYLNGQSLLQEQLKVRRELLYNSFEEVPAEFQFATAITSNDLEEIQKFLDAAVNSGCEGLIIKTLNGDATYEPSKRSLNWLKLKKDYMDSVGDSLDLVPIAAFHGRGKRTGVYGAFLLACYDDKNEEYQSICKIGTGFSEAMLEERSSSLRAKVVPKPRSYYRYAETMNPDVWFEPTEVWEVKAADLSISPVHRAASGIVDPNKGISLRFPRLIRVREDKNPEHATSADQVADMYRSQKIHHSNNQDIVDD
ncbi:Dna ligase [Thalictrum thalictroides]|uniref:DNA ligase n=1 Tax=Thalictrum thalictroides TaxID=46969 RepID=A0A7J6WJK1_THATH|nr:Dna ligase [Thalictrum thalictroides]